MNDKLIKVGISQGDINGTASELILKMFEDNRLFEFCIPVVYGSAKVLAYYRKTLELPSYNINNINHAQDSQLDILNVINTTTEENVVELGKPNEAGEKAAIQAVSTAFSDLTTGEIDILLTTPAAINPIDYLPIEKKNNRDTIDMLINNSFRIALATDKISLPEAISTLSKELLVNKIKALQNALIHDFLITSPRIAVLSLNPQAGIKDQPGKEENEIIIPAIQEASEAGIFCFGPYSADTFFGSEEYLNFDAILALYYDQGMIAFKTLSSEDGVRYTANLPVIFSSPNQNPAFDKAGKNECSPDSLRDALYLAIDIHRNRKSDEIARKNPLKKQYFERGSDNEKLDLTKDED